MEGAGGLFASNGFCARDRGGVTEEKMEGVTNGLREPVAPRVGGGRGAMSASRLTRLAVSPRNTSSTLGWKEGGGGKGGVVGAG